MTTNNSLTFQPGKFYKTRDGRKARIYATDGTSCYPIHGAFLRDDEWVNDSWTKNGQLIDDTDQHERDLIAEWKDAPSVDWSKMPAWAIATTFTKLGRMVWWSVIPEFCKDMGWICEPHPDSERWGFVPIAHTPKWSGDWRESLVTRPTEAQP